MKRYRDAGTGHFVSKERADQNPETTVGESATQEFFRQFRELLSSDPPKPIHIHYDKQQGEFHLHIGDDLFANKSLRVAMSRAHQAWKDK